MTSDELSILVSNLFFPSHLKVKDIKDIIISCVVPPLLNPFKEFCILQLNKEPMIVDHRLNTGMPIKYDNPKEVGADRIVNAVAAYQNTKRSYCCRFWHSHDF